jgi:hypothetical protein
MSYVFSPRFVALIVKELFADKIQSMLTKKSVKLPSQFLMNKVA